MNNKNTLDFVKYLLFQMYHILKKMSFFKAYNNFDFEKRNFLNEIWFFNIIEINCNTVDAVYKNHLLNCGEFSFGQKIFIMRILFRSKSHSVKFPFGRVLFRPKSHSVKFLFSQIPILSNFYSVQFPFGQIPIRQNTIRSKSHSVLL